MNTQEYFKIGSQVKYIRHDTDLETHEEHGIVRAIFLDPDGRLMVQVKQDDNAYNVHYSSVNYSLDYVKQYKDLLQDIRGTSDEGDQRVEEIVADYNARVKTLSSELLGEPVEIEAADDD